MNSAISTGYVFLSYSRDDALLMNQIRRELEKRGIRVWTDEGLAPGTESWKTSIEGAIHGASGVIVILSPSAKQSLWVERELDFARVLEKKVIPVLAHGKPSNAIPIELINAQWVDFTKNSDFEAQMQKLIYAIEGKPDIDIVDRIKQSTKQSNRQPRSSIFSKKAIFISIVVIGICILLSIGCLLVFGPTVTDIINPITPSIPIYPTATKVVILTPELTETYQTESEAAEEPAPEAEGALPAVVEEEVPETAAEEVAPSVAEEAAVAADEAVPAEAVTIPFDAAISHPNGKAYIFSGSNYYRFDFETDRFDKVARIGIDGWVGLPTGIDAAVNHPNGAAYFFVGSEYHRFNFDAGKVDWVARIGIDGWIGLPTNIDAAVSHPNGKVYFFSGNEYYRFDFETDKVDKIGQIGIDGWIESPTNIDAAVNHPNGKIYFFVGNEYHRFNFSVGKVDKIANIGIDGWTGP